MATVTRVVGVPDTRQGYDSGVHYTAQEQAEYWRRREAARAPHPAEIKAANAERERLREQQRRADNPDCRGSLRRAHAALAEARADLVRIVGLQEKAGQLVVDLVEMQLALADEVRAGNRQAANRLLAALQDGAEHPSTTPRTDAVESQLAALAAQLGVARDAAQQLSDEYGAAQKAVAAAERGVSLAAAALAVDFAVNEAEAIHQLVAEVHRRQQALWSLSSALTSEFRRFGDPSLYIPPLVSRAIGTALDGKVDGSWNERLKRLRNDAEAVLE